LTKTKGEAILLKNDGKQSEADMLAAEIVQIDESLEFTKKLELKAREKLGADALAEMEALDRQKALKAAEKRLEDLRSQALKIEGQMEGLPTNATSKFDSLRKVRRATFPQRRGESELLQVLRKLNAEIKMLEEHPTGVDEEAIKEELAREKAQHQSEMAVADTRATSLDLDAQAEIAMNKTAVLEAEVAELNHTITTVMNFNITDPARVRMEEAVQELAYAKGNATRLEAAATAANDAAMETALSTAGTAEKEYQIKKLARKTNKLEAKVEEAKEARAELTAQMQKSSDPKQQKELKLEIMDAKMSENRLVKEQKVAQAKIESTQSEIRSGMKPSKAEIVSLEATAGIRAKIGGLREQIGGSGERLGESELQRDEVSGEERTKILKQIHQLEATVQRVGDHVKRYFVAKAARMDVERAKQRKMTAMKAIQHGEQKVGELQRTKLAAEAAMANAEPGSTTAWTSGVRAQIATEKLKKVEKATEQFSGLSERLDQKQKEKAQQLSHSKAMDEEEAVENEIEAEIGDKLAAQVSSAGQALSAGGVDKKKEMEQDLANDTTMITKELNKAQAELDAEAAEEQLQQDLEQQERNEQLRGALGISVMKANTVLETLNVTYTQEIKALQACPATSRLDQMIVENQQTLGHLVHEEEDMEGVVERREEEYKLQGEANLEQILFPQPAGNSSDSSWSFQQRWNIDNLKGRVARSKKRVVDQTEMVAHWTHKRENLREQLLNHWSTGVKASVTLRKELEKADKMANEAEDTGEGLEVHRSIFQQMIDEKVFDLEKQFAATMKRGHHDCYRAVPPPEEKDDSKDGGWAEEVESTLKFKVMRIYRRELSILQQRAEEAFFEGRVKNSIDLNKEAQALVAEKPKLLEVNRRLC
jgi:hypothetical protein